MSYNYRKQIWLNILKKLSVHQVNYKKVYDSIILRSRNSDRVKSKLVYYESHHIFPDFMFIDRKRGAKKGHLLGNPNDKNNLILLTAREHFICHVLFYKMMKGTRYEYQAGSALIFFFNKFDAAHPRTTHSLKNKSKWYESCRLAGISSISKARKGMLVVKDAISGNIIGSVSVNHEKIISGEWVHHSRGRKHSEEEILKRTLSSIGMANSNASMKTDDDIYIFAKNYFIPRGYMDKKEFELLCLSNSIPTMRKENIFRFDGTGFAGLIDRLTLEFGSIPSKLNEPNLYFLRKLEYQRKNNISVVTDDDIYNFSREYYTNNRYMDTVDFGKYCKLNNIPTMQGNVGPRFLDYGGGYFGLLARLTLEFGELITFKNNPKLYFLKKSEFNVKNNTN